MNSGIVKSLLLALFSISALVNANLANAEKVVGTCKADVAGPHPFTITGKLYEGKAPDKAYESMASTRAWMLQWAEEMRSHSSTLADNKAKIANEMLYVLTLTCQSEKGTLRLSPVGGAKAADYPDGPRSYRLVNDDTRASKSGDMHAVLLSSEFQTGMIQPAEPGELKITQSDSEKLVATFSFKSKTSTVTGGFNFTRPKEQK